MGAFGLLGEPNDNDATTIIKHVNNILTVTHGLTTKVEAQFEHIRKIGHAYNADRIDEATFEEQHELALERFKGVISESLKGGINLNGFKLQSNSGRIDYAFDRGYGKVEKSIRSPTPAQSEKLLVAAGDLLDLHLRLKSLGILEYAGDETDWVPCLGDMLGNTLRALLNYLDNCFE